MKNLQVKPENVRGFIASELTRMSLARKMSNHSIAGHDPVKLLAKANRREPMSRAEIAAMTGLTYLQVKYQEKLALAKISKALRPARGEEVRDGKD